MIRKPVVMNTVLALVLGVTGAAQLCAGSDDAEGERSFLWRVTGRGGATVYLLGSVHALPQSAYPLAPAIEKAYSDSKVVVFEVDLQALESAGGLMMAAGALEPDQRLADVLSPETKEELVAYLDNSGLSFRTFSAMRPWMVALSLATLELMKAGYSPNQGLDIHLATRSESDGKHVRAFETAAFQIALFSEMSDAESEAFLRYTLLDLETVVPQLERITAAWKSGDVETVTSLLGDAFADEPELFTRLVTDRNASWLPVVRDLIDGASDALVVVGALHLVGDVGLIEQLIAEGYEVEQL